ncbi:MAG: DMT family transporter [Solirubrobacterales bacterium]
MQRTIGAHLALAGAMVIVGSSVPVSRYLTFEVPVFAGSMLRFLAAVLLLTPLMPGTWRRLALLDRAAWSVIAAQAFFGVALFSAAMFFGLRLIGASQGGILMATTPAVVYLMALAFAGESHKRMKDLGAVLAFAALVVLNGGEDAAGVGRLDGDALLGAALVLVAVLGEALFTILRMRITTTVSPIDNTVAVTVLALVMLAVPGGLELAATGPTILTGPVLAALAYMGGAVTVGAFLLWFHGVGRVSGATAGSYTTLMPLSAIAGAAIFLKEPVGLHLLISAALALAAIGCATLGEREPAAVTSRPTGQDGDRASSARS